MRSYNKGKIQGSIADIQDEALDTAIKRSLGATFAVKNVLDYEEDVDNGIDVLFKRFAAQEEPFNVIKLFEQFQVDYLLKIAFSEELHFLAKDGDTAPFMTGKRLQHWMWWQGVAKLEHLWYKTKIMNMFAKVKVAVWVKMGQEKILARKAQPRTSGQQDLLDHYLEGKVKHPEIFDDSMLVRTVVSTITAGFDTTSFTLASITHILLKFPNVYEQLQKELDEALAEGKLSLRPKWAEVSRLEYLDAVIHESMRYHPFFELPLERLVPREGAKISGEWIPGGTVVAMNGGVLGADRKAFGDDVDVFRPERWLTKERLTRLAMERAFLNFGAGKRICLGRHIAELELKKVLPAILLNYKVSTHGKRIRLKLTNCCR